MNLPAANACAYCDCVMCDRARQVRPAISAASPKARSCNPDSGLTATAEFRGHIAPTVRVAASTATVTSSPLLPTCGTRPRTRAAVSMTTGCTIPASQPLATAIIPTVPATSTTVTRATAAGPDQTPGSSKTPAHTPRTTT